MFNICLNVYVSVSSSVRTKEIHRYKSFAYIKCYITFHAIWDLKWAPEYNLFLFIDQWFCRWIFCRPAFFTISTSKSHIHNLLISILFISLSLFSSCISLAIPCRLLSICHIHSVRIPMFGRRLRRKKNCLYMCEMQTYITCLSVSLSISRSEYIMCDIWAWTFEEGQLNNNSTKNALYSFSRYPIIMEMIWCDQCRKIEFQTHTDTHAHTHLKWKIVDEWQVIT